MDSDVIKAINILFNPRNVAIYRASEKLDYFLIGLKEQNFKPEKVYLINSSKDSLFGFKCFNSLNDVIKYVNDAKFGEVTAKEMKILKHSKLSFA